MNRLTRRGLVLVLLLLGGVLGLLAAAQPWFRVAGSSGTGGGPAEQITFSGTEATGGLTQALSAVVLAGVLLTLVLAVRGRRVLAVLLAVCGLGMAVVAGLRTPPNAAAVRTRFRQVSLADQFVLDGTGWPWLYAAAGVLVLAGAVLLFVGCPTWAARTQRYQRHGSEPLPAVLQDDPAEAWRALDAGLDPTLESGAAPPQEAGSGPGPDLLADPDVRWPGPTDTMASGERQSSRNQNGDQ